MNVAAPRMDEDHPPAFADIAPTRMRIEFSGEVKALKPNAQVAFFMTDLQSEVRRCAAIFEEAKSYLANLLLKRQDPSLGDWKKDIGNLDTLAGMIISSYAINGNAQIHAIRQIALTNRVDTDAAEALQRRFSSIRACTDELMHFVDQVYAALPKDEAQRLQREWREDTTKKARFAHLL